MRIKRFNELFEGALFDITEMSPLQAVKLTDFLDSDIEAITPEDMEYYSEMTGLDADRLGELYVGYGYKAHKSEKVKGLIKKYTEKHGPWDEVKKAAEEAE